MGGSTQKNTETRLKAGSKPAATTQIGSLTPGQLAAISSLAYSNPEVVQSLALPSSLPPLVTGPPLPAAVPPSNPSLNKNVPAFLNKLYGMVSDPNTDDMIHWSEDGLSFYGKGLLFILAHILNDLK